MKSFQYLNFLFYDMLILVSSKRYRYMISETLFIKTPYFLNAAILNQVTKIFTFILYIKIKYINTYICCSFVKYIFKKQGTGI